MNNADNIGNAGSGNVEDIKAQLDNFRDRFQGLITEIQKAIVGYESLITDCLVSMFSQGHVLLEGVPGLGKTYLVRVLSQVFGMTSGRVQCTPDLMPSDVLGTHIVSEDATGHRMFRFERGPVFKHLLLVDEINRATPKTQSSLLEVMQEHCVTAGGEKHPLPEPFFVLATQNPIEMEGTYPLPEAQLDRFLFKLKVPFPSLESLVEISRRTTGFKEPELKPVMDQDEMVKFQALLTEIPIADPITSYAGRIVLATHPEDDSAPPSVKRYISYGSSPRGLQALVRGARAFCLLEGRTAVSVEDIQKAAKPALRHRLIMNFEGEAESLDGDHMIETILKSVPTPGHGDEA